jgi:hypothetical protein
MIRKEFLYGLGMMVGFAFGLTGCIENGGNRETHDSYAVVDNIPAMGGLSIHTNYGTFAIPSVTGVEAGDCIFTHYLLDYDNQPAKTYYTATEVSYKIINQSPAVLLPSSSDLSDEYNDSISSLSYISLNPLFQGKTFIQAVHPVSGTYRLKMLCHPDSIVNGVPTVFIKTGKLTNTGAYASQGIEEAFDLNPLLSVYGRDTVYTNDYYYSAEYRYLVLNVKYQAGLKDGKPVYESVSDKPIKFEFIR